MSSCTVGRTDNNIWIRTSDGVEYCLTTYNEKGDVVVNTTIPNILVNYTVGLILSRFLDVSLEERLALIEETFKAWNTTKTYWVNCQASPFNDPILQTLAPLVGALSLRQAIKDDDVDMVIDSDDGYVHYYENGIEQWDKINDYLYRHPEWLPMFAYMELTSFMALRLNQAFDTGERVTTLHEAEQYVASLVTQVRENNALFTVLGPEAFFVGGSLMQPPPISQELPLY